MLYRIQQLPVFGAQRSMFQQIRAVGEGFAELLLAAPAADGQVVAVEEGFGHRQALELGGAGVMRIVQQTAGAVLGAGNAFLIRGDLRVGQAKAFKFAGGFVAEGAGYQPHGGVDDYSGCEFASTQDIIADGKLHVAIELVDALVHAFVAAAEEDYAVEGRDLAGDGLSKRTALGAKEDHLRWSRVRLCALSLGLDSH